MIASFIIRRQWGWLMLTLVGIGIFTCLGNWQWQRAKYKEQLLTQFALRQKQPALRNANLNSATDMRFYPVELQGKFDPTHTVYLDNKIHHGRAGYEIYTPFHIQGVNQAILVDRGWVPVGVNRKQLPPFPTAEGVKIKGTLNLPPSYFALGPAYEAVQWPLRIEFIDLQMISKLLGYPVFPYVLWLDEVSAPTYQVVTTLPEKHRGYAVQWFALALTVLIVYIILINKKSRMDA